MSSVSRGLVVAVVMTKPTAAGWQVLAAQRKCVGPQDGLWEFPGGKCEPREVPRAAVIREIHEELGVHIATLGVLDAPGPSLYWPLSDRFDLAVWWATVLGGVPRALGSHYRVEFFSPGDLRHLPWLPADVAVMNAVVHKLGKSVDSCLGQ